MSQSALPVLYSFRRCPYAIRARMALYISGTQCEHREVVLRDKPAHMLELSPKATVPVLQVTPDQVIDESLDVMLWAFAQNDPDHWMQPDSGSSDDMMALIARADGDFKNSLDRYKYPNRYEGADPVLHRNAGEAFLSVLNQQIERSSFLFGNRPCLADMAIAPFVRQFANTDRSWFDQIPYPALRNWLAAFLESSVFLGVMDKYPQWQPGDPVTLSPAATD